MAGSRILRSRGRISGSKLVEHLDEDMKHVHDDIEHMLTEHTESYGNDIRKHLEEVDEHLYDMMEHSKNLKDIMPLPFLSVGEEGVIVEMQGERGITQRLFEMGFTNSTQVKVLSSSSPGPVLVEVRDSRIAIGRGIAMKIMVNKG
ncbi:MAG: FeoA family protein [Methanosarcinaceae archaeon]